MAHHGPSAPAPCWPDVVIRYRRSAPVTRAAPSDTVRWCPAPSESVRRTSASLARPSGVPLLTCSSVSDSRGPSAGPRTACIVAPLPPVPPRSARAADFGPGCCGSATEREPATAAAPPVEVQRVAMTRRQRPCCMRLDNATWLPPCCNSPPAPGCCNAAATWGGMLHPLPNERRCRCRCRCRCERLLHRPKARAATAAHPPLHVLPLHRLLSQLRLSGERCTAACCTRHRRAAVAAAAARRTGVAVAGAVDQLMEQVDAVRLRATPPRTHEPTCRAVHHVGIDQGLGEDRSGRARVLLTQPAEVDVLDVRARRLPRQIRRFALGGLTVPAPRGAVHRLTVAAGAESSPAPESGTRLSPLGAPQPDESSSLDSGTRRRSSSVTLAVTLRCHARCHAR